MRNGYFPKTAALIGGLGLGAGLMYLLDPDKGRRRRALIRDQMAHAAHTAEHAVGKASRDVGNRARGMVARAQSAFSTHRVPDDVLVARVRSHLGHAVSHPRAICVEARDGRVRLTGATLAREFDQLISSVLAVPGVTQVEDWLDIYRDASRIPALRGGRRRVGARRGMMERVWPPAARLIASLAGGAMALYGASRRDTLGAALGVVGAGMIAGSVVQGKSRRQSRAPGALRGARSKDRRSARRRINGRYQHNNYFKEVDMADYSRGYEGAGYGRRYDEDDERYGRGGRWRGAREDRGFWERAGDEVRSWFGDEEAEHRRMRDEREYGREYGRGYGRGYGREGYRQGSRGDYERGYGEYGRGVSGYGREGYGGDYESGYRRESYGGDYGQSDYGREGYYGREAGRRGRYGMSRQSGEYGYGDRGLEYGRSGQYGDYGERGYSRGSDYGRGYGAEYSYEQGYSSPYWSHTEMWLVPGPYTGRGPSGYRRSDDRITEDINERLQQHGQIDASNVSVNVNNGEVTLSGTVESRLEKRLAEDVAESCSGVREVHNNLRVRGREQEQQSQYGQQTTSTQSQYGAQSEPRSRYTTG